jgi:BirA family biotin operon repressor/biotin-[acetyl-CoA-carboxylase] ligase
MSNQPSELQSFNLPEVDTAIAGTQFAGALHYLASTPSTNDLAHAAAHAGARQGVWIAGEQTAGRGRGGHNWHSAPGAKDAPAGLYMTALISPDLPMQSAQHLSLATAIAVQSAIASVTGFRIREDIDIRWPNDLMFNMPNGRDGTARKLGGILIEASAQPAPASGPTLLRYAVVGIGINVNHTAFPPELEAIATSLRREAFTRNVENSTKCLGREAFTRSVENGTKCLRCEPLAAAILIALDREINRLTLDLAPGALHPSQDFTEFSTWITGKRVRVEARDPAPNHPAPGYTGVTAGLDPNGFLLVNGDDGRLHTVLSGGLRDP